MQIAIKRLFHLSTMVALYQGDCVAFFAFGSLKQFIQIFHDVFQLENVNSIETASIRYQLEKKLNCTVHLYTTHITLRTPEHHPLDTAHHPHNTALTVRLHTSHITHHIALHILRHV